MSNTTRTLAAIIAGVSPEAIALAAHHPPPRRRQPRPVDGTLHSVPSQGVLRGLRRQCPRRDLTSTEVLRIRKALLAARRGTITPLAALWQVAGIIGAHGVETIRVGTAWVSYADTGESYETTLLLVETDGKNPRIEVGSWGDLVERAEQRKGGAA